MVTPRTVLAFSPKIYEMKGISKKAVEEHLKLYAGYIAKYNELQTALATLTEDDYAKANQTYSLLRELKIEYTFALGGIINHELYFGHLGGDGAAPTGKLLTQIEKDFGSWDSYIRDLKASGLAARGWVWTAWSYTENRLFNCIGDAQNTYPIWYGAPVVALDVYEHAYWMDFGSARAGYLTSFLENIDWSTVARSYEKIQK